MKEFVRREKDRRGYTDAFQSLNESYRKEGSKGKISKILTL